MIIILLVTKYKTPSSFIINVVNYCIKYDLETKVNNLLLYK